MANHETHSVIAGGIESDLHIDSSKYPHPFCSLLQKRAHFDSFKHLIFIRGLLAIAHGKRKNKISASMVSFYVSLVQVMCAHYIPDTNKTYLLKSFQFVVEVHTLVFGEPSKLLIMIFISSLLMEEPSGSDQICSKLYVSAQTS